MQLCFFVWQLNYCQIILCHIQLGFDINFKQSFSIFNSFISILFLRFSILFRHIALLINLYNVSPSLLPFFSSTRGSHRSFYPIFNKGFDHLETLLQIHRPKKVLSAGSLCRPFVPSSHFKCRKRTFILPQKHQASVSNMFSQPFKCFMEKKTNINFTGQTWVRPPAKCWVKSFILPHQYHDPNFYRKFCHTLAN